MNASDAPEVSFLIVAHNAGAWLAPCVASALGQTFSDVEVVLVDNASTDGSVAAVAREFGDRRLRVVPLGENLGPYGGAAQGFGHCRGRFVALMDADDCSLPQRIARQRELLLQRPDLAVVGCDAIKLDAQDRAVGVAFFLRPAWLRRRAAALEIAIPHPTACFRRAALEESFYNTSLFSSGDLELLEWFARQGRVGGVSEILYIYRQHGSSITASRAGLQLLSSSQVRQAVFAAPDESARRAVRTQSFSALRVDPRQHGERRELLSAFAREARAAREPVAHAYFVSQLNRAAGVMLALGWSLRRPRQAGALGVLAFMRAVYPLWKHYRQRRQVRAWQTPSTLDGPGTAAASPPGDRRRPPSTDALASRDDSLL